jgi:hypothetical protein
MQIRLTLGLLVLAAVLAFPLTGPGLAPEAAAGEYPFDLSEVVGRSKAQLIPSGGRILVASTSAYESYPQVAVCASNQYLVVYEYAATDSDPNSIYG